jgi:predicted enzyme related to lactoylglutathione lyase
MNFVEGQIAFVEFPARDLAHMRRFYAAAFGWGFVWAEKDPDADYVVFRGMSTEGAFSRDPTHGPVEPLVVFYARDLEAARQRVRLVGGEITRDIHPSRGGYRFHFRDPGENEVAVWSHTRRPPPVMAAGKPPRFFGLGGDFRARARPAHSQPGHVEPAPAQPTHVEPAPAEPASPASRPIALTPAIAGGRTNHERWEARPCARMARSTM